MTMSNILSGLSATGINPFNPEIFPETAFAPSTLIHRIFPEVVQDESEDSDTSEDVSFMQFVKNA